MQTFYVRGHDDFTVISEPQQHALISKHKEPGRTKPVGTSNCKPTSTTNTFNRHCVSEKESLVRGVPDIKVVSNLEFPWASLALPLCIQGPKLSPQRTSMVLIIRLASERKQKQHRENDPSETTHIVHQDGGSPGQLPRAFIKDCVALRNQLFARVPQSLNMKIYGPNSEGPIRAASAASPASTDRFPG